ncbi:MAG: hypothetical protein ACRCVN_00350 [Spirochaetia bacterium]
MIKLVRIILLFLVITTCAASLAMFFTNGKVRTPRVLVYSKLVEKGRGSIKMEFPRRKMRSVDAVSDYLKVLLARPPVVFFQPYFEGKVEVDVVQSQKRNLYISLKSNELDFLIKKDELLLMKKSVKMNFPFYQDIQVFLNGIPVK